MRPRRHAGQGGSLDSLLDTMTNVVGILIIVLVITQIKMAEAVRRVQSNLPDISAEQLADLEDDMAAWHRAQAQPGQTRQDLDKRLREAEAKAETARRQIPGLRQTLDRRRKERKQADTAETLRKEIAGLDQALADRSTRIEDLLQEMEQVVLQLRSTPKTKEQPAKVVRLPDPKPAPKGAQPRFFICKNQRLYYADEPELRDLLKRTLERGRRGLEYRDQDTRKPLAGKDAYYDFERVKAYFERLKPGTREFLLVPHMVPDTWNRRLHYALEPRPYAGETAARIGGPTSRYRDLIARTFRKENVYLQFLVYPDSFEVYLRAREVLEEYGLPAGWHIRTTHPRRFWSPHLLYRKETHGRTKPKPPPNPDAPPQPPKKPNLVID